MSKILITSDIHFDSYMTRTPTNDYRLNQSYIVAEKSFRGCQERRC